MSRPYPWTDLWASSSSKASRRIARTDMTYSILGDCRARSTGLGISLHLASSTVVFRFRALNFAIISNLDLCFCPRLSSHGAGLYVPTYSNSKAVDICLCLNKTVLNPWCNFRSMIVQELPTLTIAGSEILRPQRHSNLRLCILTTRSMRAHLNAEGMQI